jgi:hypothetical protein
MSHTVALLIDSLLQLPIGLQFLGCPVAARKNRGVYELTLVFETKPQLTREFEALILHDDLRPF